MKTLKDLSVLLLICFGLSSYQLNAAEEKIPKNEVFVFASPELNLIAKSWATEFNQQSNFEKIQIVSDYEEAQNINLYLLKEGNIQKPFIDEAQRMVIGRDIVVPVINAQNSYINQLFNKGISTEQLGLLLQNGSLVFWEQLFNGSNGKKIEVFTSNQESVQKILSNFVSIDEGQSYSTQLQPSELIKAIENNKQAIGFCQLESIVDPVSNEIYAGLSLLPIDVNSNGKLDKIENIYSNLEQFNRGVWIGKYPKDLYQNIFAISKDVTEQKAEVDFMKWIITGGQHLLVSNGLNALSASEVAGKLTKLNYVSVNPELNYAANNSTLLILISIVFILLIIGFVSLFMIKRIRKIDFNSISVLFNNPLKINEIIFPNGVYYDKSHTWVFMEKDGRVRIGIDSFLQLITGETSRVILKDEDEMIQKGEPLFTLIHKGKQLTIKAPVSGVIKSYNQELVSDSSLINKSPYDEGWLYLIEPTNWSSEMNYLNRAEQYRVWIINEFSRLKDFIANAVNGQRTELSTVILQDGGELPQDVLSDLKPEIWEEFQINFLDQNN